MTAVIEAPARAAGQTADGLASVDEVMVFLGVSRTTVYELLKADLKSVRIGTRRLIPRAELRRYLESKLTATS